MKKLLLIWIALFAINTAFTQDIIKQNNGETIEAKITELADSYVKFYHFNDPNKVEVKMNRSLIKEVKFEYGRKEETVQPGFDESYFVNDNINNILINFTAIASHTGMLAYERSLSPTSSFGGAIKIHGAGAPTSYYDEKSGFGIEANYKVKTGNILKKNDYRPKHLLQGFYVRPNIGFTSAKFEDEQTIYNNSGYGEEYSYLHGGFDLGNQWIFNNALSLDIYTGINFFGGNYKYKTAYEYYDDYKEIADGNMAGGEGVAVRYGLQLGYTF